MAGLREAMETHKARFDAALAPCFDQVAPPRLREAVRWYPDAGGKRLRPVMAMLACEAAGGSAEDALPVALAVELVHNFSLVHDDIMDRDATRRGRPTVHTKWDEATAILAGDVLFARAFEVLTQIPDAAAHRDASRLLSEAIRRICEGQAYDVQFERQERVTTQDYLDMIRGKTALLFEAAARGGAVTAPRHDAQAVSALSIYGECFGMAFQVADDLLDVTGDPKAIGKPWGSDIRAGKRTILVLDALERATPEQARPLRAALGRADATDTEVRAAVDVLRASGAIAAAEKLRDAYAKRADEALHALPASPAREHLRALNEWARTRTL
ncbi:MAG TPA: polyprenyl synthetase family protein [Candidatus Thermoplasmatota archaeon]|nr:polyprenyl synthetase family protein [Candidatus Thermoplasmatota archaeon]